MTRKFIAPIVSAFGGSALSGLMGGSGQDGRGATREPTTPHSVPYTGSNRIHQMRYEGGGGNAMPTSVMVDPYAEMMERMSEAMAQQAAMQAEYMNQMALLQEEQLKMQQEAAKAALVENEKDPSDYAQANADDTARKQLLRRGLMSTFTRYGNSNGGGGKATKLGG